MSNNKTVVSALVAASLIIATPFVAKWEGKSNDPYRDIVGVQTVCYGETRVPMKRYSDAECTEMLTNAVEGFQKGVLRCTPSLQYHPVQLAAATSLAYNIGEGAYCRSTVAKKFNAGDIKGACESFRMWRMAGGKVSQGLVNRRNDEVKLCLTGL